MFLMTSLRTSMIWTSI